MGSVPVGSSVARCRGVLTVVHCRDGVADTPSGTPSARSARGGAGLATVPGVLPMLLAFDDYGPGPVVVLLHGFPLNRSMWSAQESTIGSIYRVIAPDLRGHGETAAPEGVYSMDDMAGDVVELLDALGIREPVV